ncbi:MAG: hypothetical protein ACRCZF_20675 [Gemmataceae bacterium]
MTGHRPFALLLVFLLASPTLAGVYGPEEKLRISVSPEGVAKPLRFGFDPPGEMNLWIDRYADIADPNPARTNNKPRQEALARLAAKPTDPQSAAEFLRTRQYDLALNLLGPRARSRTPAFSELANLAHTYALRGEWNEALRWHTDAFELADFPANLPGATPQQLAWYRKLEISFYRRWLQKHAADALRKVPAELEEPIDLFDVRFVNDAGQYEPGVLAASMKAKLPTDALAIVQQLLLWAPDDARLIWLHAELLLVQGQLREAEWIMDGLITSRQQSNRRILMEHRAALKQRIAALPPPAAAEEVPLNTPVEKTPTKLADLGLNEQQVWIVGGCFGVVVLLLFGLQVRRWFRR